MDFKSHLEIGNFRISKKILWEENQGHLNGNSINVHSKDL